MNRFILDTDHLTFFYRGQASVRKNVGLQPEGGVAISVVSIEETLSGWYSLLRKSNDPTRLIRSYASLEASMATLCRFPRVPFDEAALAAFQNLSNRRLNIGKMDLRIAATVIAQNDTLVTRNARDFARVPELRFVDWSKP